MVHLSLLSLYPRVWAEANSSLKPDRCLERGTVYYSIVSFGRGLIGFLLQMLVGQARVRWNLYLSILPL